MPRLITALLLFPGMALAGNFATCLLDKLPGIQNDVAAAAAYQLCLSRHPDGYSAIAQGSGRGFLSFSSGPECTTKKAADTHSIRASAMIGVACRTLYDEPNFFDKFDLAPPPKSEVPWERFKPFTGTLDSNKEPQK